MMISFMERVKVGVNTAIILGKTITFKDEHSEEETIFIEMILEKIIILIMMLIKIVTI